jgi:hypothetical protein
MLTKEFIESHLLGTNKKLSSQKIRQLSLPLAEKLLEQTQALNVPSAAYVVYHNLQNAPTCYCGKTLSIISFTQGFRKYCSAKCSRNSELTEHKRKNTSLERYGTESPGASPMVQSKTKKTNLERYGVHWAIQSEVIKERRRRTNQEKFGGPAAASSPEVRQRTRETNLKRYGGVAPMSSEIVKQKSRKTQITRWLPKKLDSLRDVVLPDFGEYDYNAIYQKYSWRCVVCNEPFESNLIGGKIPSCPGCYPRIKSRPELEVLDFVKSLGFDDAIHNDKTILKRENQWPLELDIVVPSLKVAIEFNGLYTHSKLNKSYHLEKYLLTKSKGFRLMHIFEDEWYEKRKIVEERIKSVLHRSSRIFARDCSLVQLSAHEMKDFFQETHLQGYVPASIGLGLVHSGSIVAAMSFGKPRFNKHFDWELLRYASKGTVVGGASKLFKKFLESSSGTVISYCDLRYGNGALYERLGFRYLKTTEPSFYYVHKGKRFNRLALQKHKLGNILQSFDPALTADENLSRNQYEKIWDCGHLVFCHPGSSTSANT